MADISLAGQYDWKLVSLSVVIAFFASYITLELAGRAAAPPLQRRNFWIPGASLCVAVGLWSVHYLGLLSLQSPPLLPSQLPTSTISLLTAFGCSLLTLFLVCFRPAKKLYLVGVNIVIGGCLSAMLFSSLEAFTLDARTSRPLRAILISLLACGLACLFAYQVGHRTEETKPKSWMKFASGAVMGSAISCIEYAGLFAMTFHSTVAGRSAPPIDRYRLASEAVICAASILLVVFVLSLLLGEADRLLLTQRGLLRSEQERWRLVISANQDGLFDFNLATGEVFYSPRWKEIIGYGPDELENTLETWQQRIHSEDRKEVDATVEEYLRGRQGTAEVEYRLRHRDGTWRWILSRSQAVWNEKGEPVRLVGSNCDITDRKRALEDLSASDARFSAFMEHNPSIAFMKDSKGRFIYTNPTLERVWKLKPGEWLGKAGSQIWPGDVARRVAEDDQEIIAGNARSELIEEFEMPDKQVHQFLTAKFTFSDSTGGRVLGGVSIDITQRVRSEENLRASEARYRELFEHNPLPSWIYRTRDSRILNVNQAAIDHYGWTRAQFLNLTVQSLQALNQPDDAAELAAPGMAGRSRARPVRHRRNRRSDIWVELSSHEFTTAEAECCLVMANDVTERIASEMDLMREHGQLENLAAQRAAELETSEAKWLSLVEALPQIVWTSRADGYCEYISRHLADYTGASVADLLGWGWLGFVHKSDRERVRTTWMAAVANRTDYEVEYRILSRDGEYRWFLTRGRSITSSDLDVSVQWLGTSSDVEDQKRRKQQLEAAIAERTLALAEARDKAQEEADAKSRFLASVSHEIRTPLNGVLDVANLISETPLSAGQRAHIDTIRSCGNALRQVVNEVLDFSKIEAGKMTFEDVEFNLESLLEDCLDVASRGDMVQKRVQFNLDLADDVPFNVIGDAARVRQVLTTVLSHVVHNSGGGVIVLAASREMLDLRFNVAASGPTLSHEEQGALLDAGDPEASGGPGLSLRVAKRLVELMGGNMGVANGTHKGHSFWFTLPLQSGSDSVPPEFRELAGKRVLLLAGADRTKIRRYLERAQMEVLQDQPADALASNRPLSLVVADALAAASGTLATVGRYPLLLIGSQEEHIRIGTVPAHEVDFLTRPIRCLPVLRAIRRLLDSVAATLAPAPGHELQDARILLVEDNQVNQLITKLFLAKLGCQVTVAGNGVEACAALEYRSYDLILMDCQMPGMDGFEATRIIRQREVGRRERTPIIALSAGVLKDERERCYAAGMDDFLSKPLDKPELESALTNWLKLQKSTIQASGS